MSRIQAATEGEARVIRWFVIVFFTLAVAGIGLAWFSKARACNTQCAASGQGAGSLKLTGGSRINLGAACVCSADSKVK